MKKLRYVHATLIIALAGTGCASESNSQGRSEYAGQEDREIKSLSREDIEELRTGKGWGLAKAAELNGVPGPVHLLQMKDEIGLSEEQLARVEQLYDAVRTQAIPLGKELIELERSLDKAFATGTIDEAKLDSLLSRIGHVYGELRYVHLAAHLETQDILTHAQVKRYNQFRGYSTKDPCDNVPEGHDPEMWRRHNDCAPERAGQASLAGRAKAFRALLSEGDYAAAQAMMAPDARRWWDAREGAGRPWTVGEANRGPWAKWDDHFRSSKETIEWKEEARSAAVVIRETNDYYRLLERKSPLNELIYYFDEDGKIEGLVIRSAGERHMGRTEEFITWARKNAPDELSDLMPDGEIDPSGDHPERFRKLLNQWREATGRKPIDPAG